MIKTPAALLKKLSAEGGTIVHSRICHPIEVEQAKQRGDFLEDKDDAEGGGFVHRPKNDFPPRYGVFDGSEIRAETTHESDKEAKGDPS